MLRVLLLIAPAARGTAEKLCEHCEAEPSTPMQLTKARQQQSLVVHPANVSAMEAFMDLTLLDIGASPVEGGIDKNTWDEAFSKLDFDGDGIISTGDALHWEQTPPSTPRNLTKVDHNLSRADVHKGMAVLVALFPDYASRVVAHEQLISELAFNGTLLPASTPPPEDPLSSLTMMQLRLKRQRQRQALVATAQSTRSMACLGGVVNVVTGVLGLLFGIIGIEMPDGSFLFEAITSNAYVVDTLLSIVGGMDEKSDALTAAQNVKAIFVLLYEEGIFSLAVEESLKQLNWWDLLVVSAQVAAIVALWLGTGGVAFVAQIALLVFDAVAIWEGVNVVRAECF